MLLPMLAGHQKRALLSAAACLRRVCTPSSGGRLLTTGPQPALRQLPGVPPPRLLSPAAASAAVPLPRLLARWSSGHHGPRKLIIQPSRHHWDHFWDDVHFYALLGIIPCGLLSLYLYVFVGPAELTEIPEGYEPQEFEYHRHPLTRGLAWFKTHWVISDQESYERDIAYKNEDYLRVETRKEFRHIKEQESLHGDYRGYYFVPVNPRPVSQHHSHRQIEDMAGDLPFGFQAEDPRELPDKLGAPRDQY